MFVPPQAGGGSGGSRAQLGSVDEQFLRSAFHPREGEAYEGEFVSGLGETTWPLILRMMSDLQLAFWVRHDDGDEDKGALMTRVTSKIEPEPEPMTEPEAEQYCCWPPAIQW